LNKSGQTNTYCPCKKPQVTIASRCTISTVNKAQNIPVQYCTELLTVHGKQNARNCINQERCIKWRPHVVTEMR